MYAKGEFLAEVLAGATLTVSQNKGTEQVAIEFRFLEGPNEGERIGEYLALTDAALPYTVAKLRTCGWAGEDISDLSMTAGTRVRLVIKHEDYQGKTRARVQFINKVREVPKLDEGQQRSVADRLRSKIAALETPPAGNGNAKPGLSEEEIPF